MKRWRRIAARLKALAMMKQDFKWKASWQCHALERSECCPQVPSARTSLTSRLEMLPGEPVLRHERKKSELSLRWFFNRLVHCWSNNRKIRRLTNNINRILNATCMIQYPPYTLLWLIPSCFYNVWYCLLLKLSAWNHVDTEHAKYRSLTNASGKRPGRNFV